MTERFNSGLSNIGRRSASPSEYDLSNRIRLVAQLNPYMGDRFDLLTQMASMPLSIDQLVDAAPSLYGAMAGDEFAAQLGQMGASAQRATFATLPEERQRVLATLGYQPPARENEGFFDRYLPDEAVRWALRPVDELTGGALGAFSKVAGTGISKTLQGLTWASDQPAHLYRTIRTMDDTSQLLAAGGAAAGLALAFSTRGRSTGGTLKVLGRLGTGSLAGGTTLAFASNPRDYARAFQASWDGEKTFRRDAVARAQDILGDSRIVTMAEDIAEADIDPYVLAAELAGTRSSGDLQELKTLEALVGRMATPGTGQFRELYTQVTRLASDDTFKTAVAALRNGKISIGRDAAGAVGLDPGTRGYSLVSGAIDATWLIAMDPTLVLGNVSKWNRARSRGMNIRDGDVYTRFLAVQNNDQGVRFAHEMVARAVETEDIELMRKYGSSFLESYPELITWKKVARVTGDLEGEFTLDVFNRWVKGTTGMAAIAKGQGTVRGLDQVVFAGLSRPTKAFRDFRASLRDTIDGLVDEDIEAHVLDVLADRIGNMTPAERAADEIVDLMRPNSLYGGIDDAGEIVPPLANLNEGAGLAYQAGKVAGQVPGFHKLGDLLSGMSTMVPKNRALSLIEDPDKGLSMVADMKGLTEMGRLTGMPSQMRKNWYRMIVNAPNPGERLRLIHGFMGDMLMLSGAGSTPTGRAAIEEFLEKQLHVYGEGGLHRYLVNGKPINTAILPGQQALAVVMPDLRELNRMIRQGRLANVLGLVDNPMVDTAMNRIWKPAVLLRMAFIPRAGGEEYLSFVLRSGLGNIGADMGARFMGRRAAFLEAADLQLKDLPLTPLQKQLLDDGKLNLLPSHIRPIGRLLKAAAREAPEEVAGEQKVVARMLARYNWSDPVYRQLEDYGNWVANVLDPTNPISQMLLPKAITEMAQSTAGLLPENVAVRRLETTVRGRTVGVGGDVAVRSNVKANVSDLIGGSPRSWRRLIAGGVASDDIEAARKFYGVNATAVMGEMSASGAGPIDVGYGNEQRQTVTTIRDNGDLTPEEFLVLRGHFGHIADDNPRFANALQESIASVVHDPVVAQVIVDVVSRIRPQTTALAETDVLNLVRNWAQITDNSDVVGLIGREFLGAPSRESFDVALKALDARLPANDRVPALADMIRDELNLGGTLEFDEVGRALDKWLDLTARETIDEPGARSAVQALRDLVGQLDGMSIVDRRWTGQLLRSSDAGSRVTASQIAASLAPPTPVVVPPGEPAGVLLGIRGNGVPGKYQLKDQAKADQATKFIGRGSPQSSTNKYAESFGELANTGVYTPSDVVFISAEGNRANRLAVNTAEIDKAVEARARFVTDIPADRTRAYNVGEREVASHLTGRGYIEVEPGLWEPPTLMVSNTAPSPFFNTWADAEPTIRRHIRSLLLDARQQERTMASLRMTGGADELQEGIIEAFVPRRLVPVDGQVLDYETLANLADDRRVFDANREIVESIIDAANTSETSVMYAVGNMELARQLNGASARYLGASGDASAVQAVSLDRRLLEGRATQTDGGWITPLAGDPNDKRIAATAWKLPADVYRGRVHAVSQSLEQQADEWADTIVGLMRQRMTRNTSVTLTPRMRARADGTKVPLVFQRDQAGKLIAVNDDTAIRQYGKFFDRDNNPIEFGDSKFFESTQVALKEDGDIMWELVGPMIEDLWDDFSRHSRTLDKGGDKIRVYRSTVRHVRDAGQSVPNFAVAEMLAHKPRLGKWDDITRFGFDRVIGPALDAIVRRPMAMHFFIQRYKAAKQIQSQAADPALYRAMQQLMGRIDPTRNAALSLVDTEAAREPLIKVLGMEKVNAAGWSTAEIHAYLRGMHKDDVVRLINRLESRNLPDSAQLVDAVYAWHTEARTFLPKGATPDDVYERLLSSIPEQAWTTRGALQREVRRRWNDPDMRREWRRLSDDQARALGVDPSELAVMQKQWEPARPDMEILTENTGNRSRPVTDSAWNEDYARRSAKLADADQLTIALLDNDTADLMLAFHRHQQFLRDSAGEYAAVASIADAVPFIDSHEFRSQFAEVAKPYLPFWYAEENFMKRWVRTVALQGPSVIRKAQLGYMGLKSVGSVRTDANGRDWFVYPGSGLLADALEKLPFFPDTLNVGIMFQSPTDSILPGFSNRFGVPAFSPLVSVPVTFANGLFPETVPLGRALLGDYSASRGPLMQVVPAHLLNLWDGVLNVNEGSSRYQSAMMGAIAQMEANGTGLPDNASPGETEDYLDRVRNHARVIIGAQAMAGFFTPGPATQLTVNHETLLGIGVDDIHSRLASEYQLLIKNMGIEQGTIEFLARNKNADPDSTFNAMAYTTGKTRSGSGAPLPATEGALSFYDQNADYFNANPYAAPWLLPPADDKDSRSQYAYDSQVINGLRIRQTPEEFLLAVKFKRGAGMYFGMRDAYLAKKDELLRNGNEAGAKILTDKFDGWSASYKAAHPVFRDQLESSDSRLRRRNVINEMRIVVNDPEAPNSPVLGPMRELMGIWDRYLTRKAQLSEDGSADGREALELFKGRFDQGMNAWASERPEIYTFYITVLRPEAGLD